MALNDTKVNAIPEAEPRRIMYPLGTSSFAFAGLKSGDTKLNRADGSERSQSECYPGGGASTHHVASWHLKLRFRRIEIRRLKMESSRWL